MDLTTNYMGLPLRNPLVASAGPLSQTVAGVRELADAGVVVEDTPDGARWSVARQAGKDND